MRKIIITIAIVVLSLCLIAVGFTFRQDLEYDTFIFLIKWQKQFSLI
ncbi:MAG: hypothetical protein ACTSRG_13465 [Candidatus Helarchaeota archaeon]